MKQRKASRPAAREPGKANASERGEAGKHGPDIRNEICGRRFKIIAARKRIGEERIQPAAKVELFDVIARFGRKRLGIKRGIDRFCGKGIARIGKDDTARGKALHRLDLFAPSHHERGPTLEAAAHVRAELERKFRQNSLLDQPGVCASDQPQRGGRVGGAAAETRRDRKKLREVKPAKSQIGHACSRGAARFEDEIAGPERGRERTFDLKIETVAGIEREAIAEIRKGDETLQFVKAVRPAAQHFQREIDLGAADVAERGHASSSRTPGPWRFYCGVFWPASVMRSCADLVSASLGSPCSILCLIVASSSSSGFSVSACCH